MGKYQAYPDYKKTNYEWLDTIPLHWEILPLKHLTAGNVKDGPHETPEFIDEGVPFLSVDGIQNNKLVFEGCRYISLVDHERYSLKCKPRRGDVLLGKAASVGKVAYVDCDIDFNVWSPLAVIHPISKKIGRFIYYSLQSALLQMQCDMYSNANTQKNLGMNTIDNLDFPFPSEDEAERIAAFLDHETAKIDALIEQQQQLIQLLKEKRQAVISHAVTKGLNPNAPMKDSGIEWLGEVPAHWEILTTKRFFRLVTEAAPNDNEFELLSLYTDIGVKPRKELEEKGNKASTTDGYWMVRKGDLVINKLLAWMGAVGYSDYEGVTSPAYDILRKTRPLNTKFFHYLFRTKLAQSEFKRWSRGIMEMRLRLYFEELGRISMPFPPHEEQTKIVGKIEELEGRYENLIATAERQISLMQERRTALISAAVTGKIDVRNFSEPATR
jgi:type I restriction enzyme S subunit